jgi:ABC-2 type transport system permease protein
MNITQALWVELLKARRSLAPLFTALGFALVPLAGGFFMIVLKDPDMARRLGLISMKARIAAGSADWHAYLGLIAQATATGGVVLFSIVATWVFGREYSDHTVKDLLALPTPRASIVLAKLVLVLVWSAGLTLLICIVGLAIGAAVGLAPVPITQIWQDTANIVLAAVLAIALATPIAFVASAGRGYLPPVGVTILLLILAQVVATAGWGEYFPWSIPALALGVGGPENAQIGAISYVIVVGTSLLGIAATLVWWERADQTQ